jgi:ketosteroid isomerase-like protein
MPASLELVKIALQAYANGDSEIVLALAGPHVRWDERASRSEGDLVWGHDKVGRAMRRYLDGWQEYRFDVEDLAEVGPGKVVGICRERGRPMEGPRVDRRFGGLWLVEDGKIVSWKTYPTPREAVRAAKELAGPQVKRAEIKPAVAPASAVAVAPAPAPTVPDPPPPPPARPEPEPGQVEAPEPVEAEASGPFDFEASEPVESAAHGPIEAQALEPAEPPLAERPRKRMLTKSEEQKRAARARANLRRSSRQSA